MMSLNARLIWSASLVLTIFIALTALTLDRAFHDSARSARQERLLGQLYLLIAAAEVDAQGKLSLPATLSEARFNLPGSGLYAYVTDRNGKVAWRSPSSIGILAPFQTTLPSGAMHFEERENHTGLSFFVQSLGINWATGNTHHAFTFSVSEDLSEFNKQINHYRQSLWGWLAALALLLLLAQAATLRWGLRPVRRVSKELSAIQEGQQEKLEGTYPREIKQLTDNLNALLQHERAQQQRYRNALADIAHSLKTPLAVVRGALSDTQTPQPLAGILEEQVARMDNIVAYQLQRAATAGASKLSTPVLILPIAEKIVSALNKVHHDKNVSAQLVIADNVAFRGDEGDLMELLGNLIENAYKWCQSTVKISAIPQEKRLAIIIEDDGPGIDPSQATLILQRGVRADQSVPGHGIGLAIVRDIVQAYQGDVQIGRSALGGAALKIDLPNS